MSWTLDGRPLRRILVTRLRYLGDIAMSTVVPAVLRREDPELTVDFLCEEPYAPLLAGQPEMSRTHVLAVKRRGRDADARRAVDADRGGGARGTLGTIVALRSRRFDLAVDLFSNPRSAWLLRLAGIPQRIGGTRSRSRGRLYTHRALAPAAVDAPALYAVAAGGLGHHLSRLAPLQAGDGRPFLRWLADEVPPGSLRTRVQRPPLMERPSRLLTDLGLADRRFTLLAPAATWPTKEWPAAHWRELAATLVADGHCPVVLCPPGGAGPYDELAAAIPAGRGGLLPPLDLGEALGVVAASGALVTVDGGIMHAAVAMGVPTVALFGPTDPGIWFPYEPLGPHRVLATGPDCAPCDRHQCDDFICLPRLSVGAVATALGEVVS